jgi:hypothetical protein
MKIRSITCFFDPNSENANKNISELSLFVQNFRDQCEDIGISVQTSRLSTPSFAVLWPKLNEDECVTSGQSC